MSIASASAYPPAIPLELLERLSEFMAKRMGLHFPPERWRDLAMGVAHAVRDRESINSGELIDWILSDSLTTRDIENLASHFTVGETYFFREKPSFEILQNRVLPELIRCRRDTGMRLRFWSAGCCSGEEPYSLAMVLDGLLPDIPDWNVTILATDINPAFIAAAQAGIFGEWSFRAIPPGIKDRYFMSLPGGKSRIVDRIREMVTFSCLNLAEDPNLVTETNAMDVVLCRNVLMYFTREHAARAIGNFHRSLIEGGWLLVAPSETSQSLFRRFRMVSFADAIFYRKSAIPVPDVPILPIFNDMAPRPVTTPFPDETLFQDFLPSPSPRLPETIPESSPSCEFAGPSEGADSCILMARDLANGGKLEDALSMCDKAVAADALDPGRRFLRAMVAEELGLLEEAACSLERALYLDQDFIMAHYALANLSAKLGRQRLSGQHFRCALALLEGLTADAAIPESAGLTASRLAEIIRSTPGSRKEIP